MAQRHWAGAGGRCDSADGSVRCGGRAVSVELRRGASICEPRSAGGEIAAALSDHPVFVRYFREGNAVRFFRGRGCEIVGGGFAGIGQRFRGMPAVVGADESGLGRFAVPLKFADVLDRLAVEWGMSAAVAQVVRSVFDFHVFGFNKSIGYVVCAKPGGRCGCADWRCRGCIGSIVGRR